MHDQLRAVSAAVDYIESHLTDKLDLTGVAQAVHYSKYYLHRVFAETVGLTIHDYIKRRKLTEAARLLCFTGRPILDIALTAGYESQQAFTTVFKQMYKQSPRQFRRAEAFYPLQLRCRLNAAPTRAAGEFDWQRDILPAEENDIPAWMELVRLVVDGFPYLREDEYLRELRQFIRRRQAWALKGGAVVIGAMAFDRESGSIDFWGIHPQYRRQAVAQAFLRRVWAECGQGTLIQTTTFREGDKADPGYRAALRRLGFAEAELLVEFGYPTQRFILLPKELMPDEA